MRNRLQARPQLETLESTVLLSGVATALPQVSPAEISAATTASNATLTLSGTEDGKFHTRRNHSETTYEIKTTGTLTALGSTTVTGNLDVTSGFSSGPPSGTLTLATRQGTLTLQVPKSVEISGGLPTATSANEIVDTYVISKGTRAYRGATGSGVVEFTFAPSSSSRAGSVSITFTTTTTTVAAAPMIPATSAAPMIPATA